MTLSRAARHYIRYAEIAALVVLGIIALVTYRELTDLRKAPVALPNYEFEVSGADAEKTVQTRGTWITEKGVPERLQTITIECRKATMRCMESAAAVVFVEGRGVLESNLTEFEIDKWSDKQIVAKPRADNCLTRTLTLDLGERRARSQIAPAGEAGSNCRPVAAHSLELVAGYKLREQKT